MKTEVLYATHRTEGDVVICIPSRGVIAESNGTYHFRPVEEIRGYEKVLIGMKKSMADLELVEEAVSARISYRTEWFNKRLEGTPEPSLEFDLAAGNLLKYLTEEAD